jgi:predicted dithiol-disulfide oxidoreductase (DUF899 family)
LPGDGCRCGYAAGCPTCSTVADGFDGSVVHLAHHDVTLGAVSQAPLAKPNSPRPHNLARVGGPTDR